MNQFKPTTPCELTTVSIDGGDLEWTVSFCTATHTIIEIYGCRWAAVQRLHDLANGDQTAELANCFLGARVRYG